MRTWTVALPYDKPPLSLNDRGQTPGARAAKSKKAAQIRADVATLVRHIPPLPAIHVRLHYRPKDNRRRDADNLIATQKPAIDALVDAGIVPDDCAPYVDWSRPLITAKGPEPRLWLVITEATATAPEENA